MDRNSVISARQVQGLIADGHTIVIYNGHVLQLDSWLHKHPGGLLPIAHMVGRDATNEINAYHLPKTQRLMKAYRIAKVKLPWTNLTPPIRSNDCCVRGEWQEEKTVAPTDDDDSDWSSSTLPTSTELVSEKVPEVLTTAFDNDTDKGTCVPIVGSERISGIKDEEQGSICEVACTLRKRPSRTEYIASLEQDEIDSDMLDYPSLDFETQEAISKEYGALHERIKKEGFYQCRYSEYGKDAIRWGILFSGFLGFLYAEWYITSAVFLGMFWQQIMFVAHDAGHRGITGNFVADTLIGAFVADFCCGLSIGWWKSSHNVHHLITNMPEHDPDLQNVPIFSTSPSYFRSLLSSFYNFTFVWDAAADVMVRYQKWTYYPVMALARFNLYFLSWCHLMSPRSKNLGSAAWTRPVEIAMMACYWALFGYGLVWRTLPDWPTRVAFVLTSHIATMLLHVQITLSHWGMPTADLGPSESFPQRQLRTTMDIDCPPWLDFLHGGLQFQAIHHLFPRVPRHNLRGVQGLVRVFCEKTQIKYRCYGFVEGNHVMLSRLEEVTKMAETLLKCQLHMAKTGDSGLH
ncbi:fatty acid/sphingolipid desaturase [Eremomyces bilateralis CBS 781.70]|uniref:Delta 8-(E)-sphingolipid desaturase n=1 Tax=Eremomyces bilateralis CBS 781.70 TaxID=1392243 RepID=A0A6G1GCH0_9PEZI|nr:fatty acid/sphingolipid desaturase [Eremomyces bilateralis CBS 781.70]KAF1815785.1 fatty acid/sphingolipid desaturase [Eremomyces bilateralis CBS 781.70]